MTTTTPPADAFAKDAHWQQTLARLEARQRPVAELRICDDHQLKADLANAQLAERKAMRVAEDLPDEPEVKKALRTAQAAVKRAQDAVDAATIVLRFQALERTELKKLKAEHPPTEEQAEDGFEFNLDTFAPVLLAAASLDGMTADAARRFLDTWSDAEADQLLGAAWSVQSESRMDLGKG